MDILFVSPRQCWPAASGAKLRDFHLAKALGSRCRLHYAFFSAAGATPPTRRELPFCHDLIVVPPAPSYTAGNLVRGLLGRWPLPVLNYTSPQMTAALGRIAATVSFDLVHLDSIHLAAYEPLLRRALPSSRIVYDWHNIESDIMYQYAAKAPSPARKLYSAVTARKLAALERRMLKSAFGHLVCSERERDKLAQWSPGTRIEVIENGVEIGRFPNAARPDASRHRIVFVGLMNYHANVEAVAWFTRNIWPGLRKRFPNWKLTLVGADPAPAVLELRREEGVEVTGTVPDIAPYYEQAVAAIVPLLSGGGTRLKILEAMAAGVPVVSTPIGAEGLDVSPGDNILLAPTDNSASRERIQEKWTAALDSLASQGPLWTTLSSAGRALVESRYDWDALGRRLYDTYCRWLEPVP
jgi:polysaccharide biosynthesis protein PslH